MNKERALTYGVVSLGSAVFTYLDPKKTWVKTADVTVRGLLGGWLGYMASTNTGAEKKSSGQRNPLETAAWIAGGVGLMAVVARCDHSIDAWVENRLRQCGLEKPRLTMALGAAALTAWAYHAEQQRKPAADNQARSSSLTG